MQPLLPHDVGPATMAFLCAVSFVAGLVDAIAGGGGLLSMPSLLAVGLPPHFALGTNKGQSTFGTLIATWTFYARGEITRSRLVPSFVAGALGAAAGAAAVLAVRPEPLKPIVLGMLLGAAVLIVVQPYLKLRPPSRAKLPTPAPTMPMTSSTSWTSSTRPALIAALIALAMGMYDGFFGPGTGSLLILMFVLWLGDSMTRASGNAKVVNLASNLTSLTLFAVRGTVVWSIALPMAACNTLGGYVGARLAVRNGDQFVRWTVFAVVVALLAKLGVDLL